MVCLRESFIDGTNGLFLCNEEDCVYEIYVFKVGANSTEGGHSSAHCCVKYAQLVAQDFAEATSTNPHEKN